MYKKYKDSNNNELTRGIMGTWSCNRNNRFDREDRRDCRNWYEHEENKCRKNWWDIEEDERGQREDRCDRREDERGRKPKCKPEKDEKDNNIYINTDICIKQEARPTGGNGGNGGEAEGGDAAQASGGLLNLAVNEIELEANLELPIPLLDNLKQAEGNQARLIPEENNGAQGGDANANGGNGGNAYATNVAEVTVENVIIITGDNGHPMPPIHLGANGRNMDIKIDKEGNAFVNGKKLDAQELGDGLKVLVYRDNQVKKEEKNEEKNDEKKEDKKEDKKENKKEDKDKE